jgi:serine/threonine-protein kinase
LNKSSTHEDLKRSVNLFRQALARDPDYALAHASIAEAYYAASNIYEPPVKVIPLAKKACARALQIDDGLGEAHALLGVFHAVYDWDWPAAEGEFRRGVELAPNSPVVHLYYGMGLCLVSRFAECRSELDQARELDPRGVDPITVFARVYNFFPLYLARDYDQAIPKFQALTKTFPQFYLPYAYLGLCYEQKADYDKAIAAFKKATELDDNLEAKARLGHAYAVAGRRQEALQVLAKLQGLAGKQYVSPYNIALIHLGLNDRDQAFALLEKAAEDHSEWFASLRVDPRLDPIRRDPRFEALLKRLKLGPAGT